VNWNDISPRVRFWPMTPFGDGKTAVKFTWASTRRSVDPARAGEQPDRAVGLTATRTFTGPQWRLRTRLAISQHGRQR
jgi:hypothetical protein